LVIYNFLLEATGYNVSPMTSVQALPTANRLWTWNSSH